MKHIPNLISCTRIIASLMLLLTKAFSIPFLILYIICGISDVLDGYIARKTNNMSKLGAVLDSIADFIFIGILMIKILPVLDWSLWMLVWIGVIAALRFISLGIGYIKYHAIAFLHTYGNKATGFLLFYLPLLYLCLGLTIAVVMACIIASLSAMEELLIHITSKDLDRDIKSIVVKKNSSLTK